MTLSIYGNNKYVVPCLMVNERAESADPEIVFQNRDNVDGSEIGQGDIHARYEDRGEGVKFYFKERTCTDRVFIADFRVPGTNVPLIPRASKRAAFSTKSDTRNYYKTRTI